MSTESQPVAKVEWVDRDDLRANDWNPNIAPPPEFRLLILSIRSNGWTQPIVVREEDGGLEIVDGYHRWRASAEPEVARLTGGLVPVVRLRADGAAARLATVRHNRARGVHHVVGMADIVQDLLDAGMPPERIQVELGMDEEEVSRLRDRGLMTARGRADGFRTGWTV